MIVFPAVDVKDGRCVRLEKGRPDTARQYYNEPWVAAAHWQESGATWLHVVDLDGALSGNNTNSGAIKKLIQETEINIQIGGGIRSETAITEALKAGVKRVVIGTQAVKDPQWTIEQCISHPGEVVVALDAVKGRVSVEGWRQSTETKVEELAQVLEEGRPAAFLYTDVERDGMLSHPHFSGIKNLLQVTDIPVIASGGVSSLEDIQKLGACGADGVITGKALYEEKFCLQDAIAIANKFQSRLE